MPTQIQQDMINLQEQILDNKYYDRLYARCLKEHDMSNESIKAAEHTDHEIVSMANTFWFELPDSPSIRTSEFFALCSIAEHCFDGGEDQEP